jgi:hypothetical protein
MLPAASSDGTADADLLAYANEELQHRLMADIMAIREEYFVRYLDTALVSGRTEYRIPKRAAGGVLRDVALVNSSGNLSRLPRISPERLDQFDVSSGPQGYVVRGNSIVLVGQQSTSLPTLRLFFFARPSELVGISSNTFAPITAINTGTNTITVGTTAGLTSGDLDLMAATPGFEHLALDQTPTGTTATTITFGSTLPVTVKVLEAVGDEEGMVAAQKALLEMEEKAKVLATPRVEGSLEKIINRNSGLRGRGMFRRWF